MLKIVLYLIAAFFETWLGIWIFAQAFPKRTRMERRHQVSEWVLITAEMLFTWSFSTFYIFQENKKDVFYFLLVVYILLFLGYFLYKKRQQGRMEKQIIVQSLFIISCSLLFCQYWTSYESIGMIFTVNVFPLFFLFAFYVCSFNQAYLWELFYLTNIGIAKAVYIIYKGTFENRYLEDFFYYPRNHTYGEIGYWFAILLVTFLLMKCLPIKNIIRNILEKHRILIFLFALIELVMVSVLVNKGSGKAEEKNLAGILIVFIALVFC